MYTFMQIQKCKYGYVYTSTCIYVYVYVYVNQNIPANKLFKKRNIINVIFIYIVRNAHVYTHLYTHVQTYTHIYIYKYTYIHTCYKYREEITNTMNKEAERERERHGDDSLWSLWPLVESLDLLVQMLEQSLSGFGNAQQAKLGGKQIPARVVHVLTAQQAQILKPTSIVCRLRKNPCYPEAESLIPSQNGIDCTVRPWSA